VLWRLHIRPDDVPPMKALAYCHERKLIGLGWRVDRADGETVTRDLYFQRAKAKYGKMPLAPAYFIDRPAIGDLVWLRNLIGIYSLARINKAWQYQDDEAALAVDMINVRCATIRDVGPADAVPGKVRACFIPPIAFQAITDRDCEIFSRHLFARLAGESPPDERLEGGDLLTFLGHRDLEDLVLMYLQLEGWVMIPNTRKPDTIGTEWVLMHRDTEERAFVQIKSGNTHLDARAYGGEHRWFLFAASQAFGPEIPLNVVAISRAEIEAFVRNKPAFLPKAVRHWQSVLATPAG
jgi:hypothetical protein